MKFSNTHNMYFIAIVCPPELDKKILQFKIWMKEHFGSVVALKSPAHITLIQPIWQEERQEEDLLSVLYDFRCDLDELVVRLIGFSYFGKKVLFVKVQSDPFLEELKQRVENHFDGLFGAVMKKDDRPFHPHITIANRDLKPGDFEKAWQHFENLKFEENFPSQKISLLKLNESKWKVIGEKSW